MTFESDQPAFNLLDEPWIPVRFLDGTIKPVGLLECFAEAGRIRALAETSPPNLIALYRLLLAVTHRALSLSVGTWKDKDRARWFREGFPEGALEAYLEQWRERFWLFHPQAPFMQVAALATAEETRDKVKPWTQISLASSCGAAPVLFDHAMDEAPASISPASACILLLGFLQFTPGGLVKVIRGSDNAGPLANTAAVFPCGKTLHETILFSLPSQPSAEVEDLPAWEQPPPTLGNLRADACLATGPNDRYTRLSRAVLLLLHESDGVRCVRFAAGLALKDDPNAPDPMASYRPVKDGLVRLTFREGRAFWRDLPVFVPDTAGAGNHAAAVLGHAGNLRDTLEEHLGEQTLLVAGLASDQAKLLRWRLEQIELPAAYLTDPDLGSALRDLLQKAESLFADLRKLARGMYASVLPDHENKEAYTRAGETVDAGPAAATFFAEAERTLPRVLRLIAESRDEEADEHWRRMLLGAADKTWDALRRGLGSSPRALRAEAESWPKFRGLLRKKELLPKPTHAETTV